MISNNTIKLTQKIQSTYLKGIPDERRLLGHDSSLLGSCLALTDLLDYFSEFEVRHFKYLGAYTLLI